MTVATGRTDSTTLSPASGPTSRSLRPAPRAGPKRSGETRRHSKSRQFHHGSITTAASPLQHHHCSITTAVSPLQYHHRGGTTVVELPWWNNSGGTTAVRSLPQPLSHRSPVHHVPPRADIV